MFRYIAFVWNDADPVARGSADSLARLLTERSQPWRTVVDRGGLRAYCIDENPGSSEPYVLHGDSGAVMGKLFRSGAGGSPSVTAPLQIPEGESRRIVESAGRRLIDSYWGRYVAFVHDEAARVTRVIRDPSSGLPCFTVSFGGVQVYFSRMDDLPELPGRRFTINWKYVAATLCQTQLHVPSTALNEVEHILGGECVEHRDGRTTRQFYWTLLDAARVEPIEDPTEATHALRAVTRDCVHAWASSYRGIVHMLSGGLDSSIILACLRDAPIRPTNIACLNYYSTGSNTDERGYAQLAARSADCELIELERNSALSLEPLLRLRRSPLPADYFFYLDEGRTEARVAAEQGARGLFTGYGGDQIFYRAGARHGAGDYLRTRGLNPALFEVALDAARVDRISVWSVLGQAIQARWLGKRWNIWDEQHGRRRRLIRQAVSDDIRRDSALVHPAMQFSDAPDGKRYHAYQLLFPLDFYNPLGSETDPEIVAPLFSQPLLELAMRVPTWVLTHGGWDRALARRAFQHEVPRQIVTRRTKGGQEEHAKAILLRNFGFVRNLLLDGYLVREGLLEKSQVTEVLSPGPARLNSGNAELFGCLSAEAWVRQWTTA